MPAKILVMDNDATMRELLRLHLRNAGYEVSLAEDAVVAGRLLLQQRPDMLLAEIDLPYMSGLDLIEAMKSEAATASLPVIVLTTKKDSEPRARQLGAVAYLTKPLHLDRLLATLAQHLEDGAGCRIAA